MTTATGYDTHAPLSPTLAGISIGAVISGVVITLIVQVVLGVLGLGLGLATVDPATAGGTPSASSFSIAAGVWAVVSGVLAAGVGGYVAARVSRSSQLMVGVLTGLTSWAAATLIALYLLTTTVGALIGGAFGTVSSALGGLGQAAVTSGAAAAPALGQITDPLGAIEQQVRQASGGDDPATLRDKAVSAVRQAMTGDAAQQEQAKTAAAEALAKSRNVPVEQARADVDRYIAQYKQTVEQAKQKATVAADAAARTTSIGALFAFLALVLGAAAAGFGGRQGSAAARGW